MCSSQETIEECRFAPSAAKDWSKGSQAARKRKRKKEANHGELTVHWNVDPACAVWPDCCCASDRKSAAGRVSSNCCRAAVSDAVFLQNALDCALVCLLPKKCRCYCSALLEVAHFLSWRCMSPTFQNCHRRSVRRQWHLRLRLLWKFVQVSMMMAMVMVMQKLIVADALTAALLLQPHCRPYCRAPS